MSSVVIENVKLKVVLAISTSAPITIANEAKDTPPTVAQKTIKAFSQGHSYIYKVLSFDSV